MKYFIYSKLFSQKNCKSNDLPEEAVKKLNELGWAVTLSHTYSIQREIIPSSIGNDDVVIFVGLSDRYDELKQLKKDLGVLGVQPKFLLLDSDISTSITDIVSIASDRDLDISPLLLLEPA